MKNQSHIHVNQGIGQLFLKFRHQMGLVTHLQLCHAMSSKVIIEPTTIFCIPLLLQSSNIIQKRFLYMEI